MKRIVVCLISFFSMLSCHTSTKNIVQTTNKQFENSQEIKGQNILLQKGIDFVGEGDIPTKWKLEIGFKDTIRFIAEDGIQLKFAYNQTQKKLLGDTIELANNNNKTTITIFYKPCNNNTAKKVTVAFNATVYKGCGKYTSDNNLVGKWILEKIGNEIINANEYNTEPFISIKETKETLSGNDGCNIFKAAIQIEGRRIRFKNMVNTKMGCSKKDISFIVNKYLNNQLIDYYFKDNKLLFYLIDDSVLVFRKG